MTDPHDERPYLAEWWPRVGATLLDLLIVWALSVVAIIASFMVAAPFGGESDVGAPVWLLVWAQAHHTSTVLDSPLGYSRSIRLRDRRDSARHRQRYGFPALRRH